MDGARWERVQSLFHAAVERPETEWRTFLDEVCAGDEGLRTDVFTMLEADRRSASLLDRGLPEIAYQMIGASNETAPSSEFGPYRLVRMLGEGGMGVVWLAEREDAGNLVAIKFLPNAGLSPARRDRFAREIKTLARLKHPYIARLYDAGTLTEGTPWFVMEYVDGLRLTEYCDRQELTVDERLRLFRRVCEAVQYAHGQEIIHRDLKPSNILVEKDGTPRLLDFGIAREFHGLDDAGEKTRPGLRFVSPGYAATEWILDGTVGLYTDVYSLGVILAEILPAASKSGRSDLDILCAKATRKEAAGRYVSVEALIRDIDHYLNGEPLEARPGTLRYRLGKFVTRNWRMVVATSLALTVAIGLVIFFTVRLTKARNAALAEAERTKRIQAFMLNLFGDGDKEAAPSHDLRVLTLIDRGVQEADTLRADPQSQAELYESLGRMYERLGKFQKSDELLRLSIQTTKAAVGPDDPRVAEGLIQLGLLREDQANMKDAERLLRQGIELLSRRSAPNDPAVVEAKADLGSVMAERGLYDEAAALVRPLIEIPPKGEEGTSALLKSLTALASIELSAGQYTAAEGLLRRALVLDRRIYGNEHPRVATELGELASAEATLGRLGEAERLYREALGISKSWYGEDHPDTAFYSSLPASILIQERNFGEAAPLLERVLAIQERTYGAMHPYVAAAVDSLGRLEMSRGNLEAAEADFQRAVTIDRASQGETNHQTAIVEVHLAQVYLEKSQDQRAEPLLRQAVKTLTARPRPGNMSVGVAQLILGGVLLREKHFGEAEKYLAAAYGILEKQPGSSYSKRLQETRQELAKVYGAWNQPEKAAKVRSEFAANEPK